MLPYERHNPYSISKNKNKIKVKFSTAVSLCTNAATRVEIKIEYRVLNVECRVLCSARRDACQCKIVQTESRTSSLFECYAEVQPIPCRDIHYLRGEYDSNHNN